jgi:hypothetical protein
MAASLTVDRLFRLAKRRKRFRRVMMAKLLMIGACRRRLANSGFRPTIPQRTWNSCRRNSVMVMETVLLLEKWCDDEDIVGGSGLLEQRGRALVG